MSFRRLLAPLALATLARAVCAGPAYAVCTADDIYASEASCPKAAPDCVISGHYTVDDGCTLDFGARNLTLLTAGRLTVGSRTATISAAHIVIFGLIDGVSDTDPRGGMLMFRTSGDFEVRGSGQIDVSGNSSGGDIVVDAGGSVSILGKVKADSLNAQAAGGLLDITAAGNITSGPISLLSAHGGNDSDGGGEIDLTAGHALTLQTDLDVDGYDGGFLELQAGDKITMQGADVSGAGDAGSGGCVDITAGAGAEIQGQIVAKGASGSSGGGCGGLICLDGGLGDLTIGAAAVVNADGASPDGGGGQITLLARGSAIVNGRIEAHGPDGETCGGDLCIETGYDVTVGAGLVDRLDISGGDSGGDVELTAGRDMVINGGIDVSGRQAGSLGGDLTLRAGALGRGSLTLNSGVDVSSKASCGADNNCGQAGTTDLQGCNVTVTAAGVLLANGPDAGENDLTAREQLTVQGTLNATRTNPMGALGINRFVYRSGKAPIVQGNGISPAAVGLALTTCPEVGETLPPCLMPCPVCGNGVVEFPETCDQGIVPPQSCSGCSTQCQTENCDDGRFCTGDSCSPAFGCVNQPTPLCTEPPPTATGTPPTPTATPTASVTPSVTATRSGTATVTPTATPSLTLVPTATVTPFPSSTPSLTVISTATPIDTATASASATPTVTLTPAATDTAVPTDTASATATASATDTPSPVSTVLPACAGDCNGNRTVTVDELIVGVNMALGNTSADTCPAFDRNGDHTVSISELVAAVNAAQSGC
jgi:hypothetical protein